MIKRKEKNKIGIKNIEDSERLKKTNRQSNLTKYKLLAFLFSHNELKIVTLNLLLLAVD